jgi:hypothetical protein
MSVSPVIWTRPGTVALIPTEPVEVEPNWPCVAAASAAPGSTSALHATSMLFIQKRFIVPPRPLTEKGMYPFWRNWREVVKNSSTLQSLQSGDALFCVQFCLSGVTSEGLIT